MTVRIPWDRYEVALLFSAYEQVANGADISAEAAKLSETLRVLAIRRGVSIDDTYRNVNGMKMQLANVQYLFTGGQKGLSGASAMIRQMYELYKDTPAEYQTILKEAIRLTGSNESVEDAFFTYAKERIGLSPRMLAEYMQKAADYCHLKQPLLGMTEVKAVRNVQQKIAEGKLLRFRYGKDAQTIRNVTRLYYTFIKSYRETKEEPPVPVVPAKEKIVTAQPTLVVDATVVEPTFDPQTVAIVEVSDAGASEPSASVLREEITVETIDDRLWVDFSQDNSYLFTKPVSYIYKGVLHDAKSWNRLYVEVCGLLFTDHREAFMGIMNGDVPGYNVLAFADEQNYRRMRVPKSFVPGYYLESNLDATSIVRRIRGLYQLFKLGDGFRISYIKLGDARGIEVPVESAEEWLIHELRTKKIPYVDNRPAGGCLWIASDMSIPIPLNEATEKGYRFRLKQDGCRAFPNRPVIWTKDQPKQPAKAIPIILTSDGQISLDAFKRFLIHDKGFAERTAGNYWTSIRMIEAYIQRNKLDFSLLNTDAAGAQRIFDLLMARPDFEQINIQRHRQFSAALVQYVIYLRQGGNIVPEGKRKLPGQKTIIETVFDVLRQAGKPMTVSEIYQAINRGDLYPFGAQDPQSVVYSKVSLACRQTEDRIKEGRDVLIRSEVDGRKVFQVMSAKEGAAYLQAQQRKSVQETASPWAEYEVVLTQAFPKGFQKESGLDMKKLRKRWAEIYGDELKDSDDTVRMQLAAHCVDTGKRWYLAELLLSDDDRQMVLGYIDRVLDMGKSVLYYSSLYAALEHQLESTVLTEALLISYLLATCQDRYILREYYLTNDCHAQVDLSEEIKDVMLAHGRPIHTDELKQALHHLPPDQVERELHIRSEFILDAFHMYFHESMADLTDQELDQIAAFIQEELDDQGYMIGDWIQRKLARLYPETAERLSFLTLLGVRGAVAYKLRDRFTFSGPVITPKGKAMNMIDIFAGFCQRHTPFTLDELAAFAKECDSAIYLDTVHKNCARVSEKEFVATGAVCWNISHIDAAIALHCPGKYVSLKSIQYFDAFPYVGYSWNSYLLEQYVATVSHDFTLMHSSYAKNNTSGAIVRRDAGFESFDDVLADILANAPVNLEKDTCLEYLADVGYITRRKLSSINETISRAKMLRSQKG
ncbi:MAG: hypothetical protein J6K32_08560 [Clostridia bacterium]|nr:hypothetical protein [Clostridia bacterium]